MIVRTKRRIAFVFLLGFLSLEMVATAQTPEQSPPENPPRMDPQDPHYRYEVEVELVNITATVLDESGTYVHGLKPEDFQIFEDGQPQKVSFFSHDLRVPISVGILVDCSGSMKYKIQQALQTVREIALALSPQDEMFLVSFDSEALVRHRLTSDAEKIHRSLRDVKASGETVMYDAIAEAMGEMKAAKYAKKILILVTDGFDTRSRITSTQVEEILKRSEVLVYAIGIDDDDNDPSVLRRTRYHIYHHMLNRLTGVSGGRAFRMFTGRNSGIKGVAQLLLDELHQQYTLGYYPTSMRHGNGWRQVEVKMKKSGSQIRHRRGYYIHQAGSQRH